MKKTVLMLFFTIVSIAINCLGSYISGSFIFPVYLDSLLTIFLVFKFNLLSGILCAILTNLIIGAFSLVYFPFAICHISTVVMAYIVKTVATKRNKKIEKNNGINFTIDEFLFTGFFSAITNTILGNFLALHYYIEIYSGAEKIFNADFLSQIFYFVTKNINFSIYLSGFISNVIDKTFSALVSFGVFKLYESIEKKLLKIGNVR